MKEIFSQRLKQAREKKGISLKDLRDKIGVSQSTMSHYSSGNVLPTLDTACKIAEALDVTVDWLCGRETKDSFSNYGDVARAILGACNAITRHAAGNVEIGSDDFRNITWIKIENQVLDQFFYKASKYQEMASSSKDERELYDAWVEVRIKELEKFLLVPEFDEVADEDLPF